MRWMIFWVIFLVLLILCDKLKLCEKITPLELESSFTKPLGFSDLCVISFLSNSESSEKRSVSRKRCILTHSILSVQTIIEIDLSPGGELITILAFSWDCFVLHVILLYVWNKAVVKPGLFGCCSWHNMVTKYPWFFILACIPPKCNIPILSYLFDRKRTQRGKGRMLWFIRIWVPAPSFIDVFFYIPKNIVVICVFTVFAHGDFLKLTVHAFRERG